MRPIPSGFNWELHLNQSQWRPYGSGATKGRNLTKITRWIDRELKFDPLTERFIDADDANAWNDRPRRSGYELPTV